MNRKLLAWLDGVNPRGGTNATRLAELIAANSGDVNIRGVGRVIKREGWPHRTGLTGEEALELSNLYGFALGTIYGSDASVEAFHRAIQDCIGRAQGNLIQVVSSMTEVENMIKVRTES